MKTQTHRSRTGFHFMLVFAAVLWVGAAFGQAKSVILLIGDGMGPMTVKAASIKLKGADGKLVMQGFPVKGSLITKSASSNVTDSAAGATALATGNKTNNGMVGMAPDGTVLKTILEACRDTGKATGLVATSSVTDATPASFASHVKNRGMEYEIAGQLIASRVNVILGAGKTYFLEPKGDSWIGIDFVDASGNKVGRWGERMRWTADQEAERTFVPPAGTVKANLWIWRESGLVAFFDDFKLEPKGGNPSAKLVNGDFEKGDTSGWSVWSGCEIVSDGGSSALKVSSGGGCQQAVAVEPGREYSFGYRGRISDPEAGKPDRRFPWDAAGDAGYLRIETRNGLAGARGPFVLGLFQPDSMEMEPGEPTLAEMARKAMELLGSSEKGFFLMVEGSQVDWAAHSNDAKDLFRQMASFDEAVKTALAYAKKRADVLVVVAADHETGGVSVEGSMPATLKVAFSTKGHTSTNVPLFAYGPGSEAFAGLHDNTDVPKLIAKALSLDLP